VSLAVSDQSSSPADPSPPASVTVSPRAGIIRVAGLASLGAGAIHAAAIGVHAEERPAAITFTVVAALQIVWGAWALLRPTRPIALVGLVTSAAAVGGWLIAKLWGLWFIPGLDIAEPVQTADGLAAGLAIGAGMLLLVALLPMGDAPVSKEWAGLMPIAAVSVVVLSVVAVAAKKTQVHDHGEGGESAHSHGGSEEVSTDEGHSHTESSEGHASSEGPETDVDGADASSESITRDEHEDHADPVVKPYDPSQPIDLGGVEGVTPQQQAAAENLVAVTLHGLPQWSDPAVAEAAGFRSIGDGFSGVEHFINQAFIDDAVTLDPDRPESLVYSTEGGGRRLVAAMFMWNKGTPLDQIPDIGGKLMQWHVHDNLCYNAEGKVVGITNGQGDCPPGLVKPVETPMIHVWIEPHKCGPFAALEGIAGGRIPQGEAVLCDHAHGSS